MLILIGVTVFVGAFVVTVIASAGRRSGLLDLGSVSTQWLAEHREYRGWRAIAMTQPVADPVVPFACPDCLSDQIKGPDQPGKGLCVLALPEVRRRVESRAPARPDRGRGIASATPQRSNNSDYWHNK